ncbi:hypothetical protein [Fluviicola sp.]|uniref:hypothetical protein n=1 Tax=Fluviicola sp. TaxID=1917219 RepID=UPI00262467FF|nr:hypothetical protein [Fluviicola sp.]
MTPNRAKIVLTNPCSENWDSMPADAIGRFCQSCQKSVIDFSSKSDDEIKTFLKDKQGENLCGRFQVHQVERIRIEIDPNLLISAIPSWQKFLVVFLICFGQDFLGVDFIFAQTETDSIPVKTEQVDSLVSIAVAEPDSTLEAAVDSVQKPIHSKKSETIVLDSFLFGLGEFIGGSVMLIDEHLLDELGINLPGPFPKIPLSQDQPEEDTTNFETGITQMPQNNPFIPKRPQKKPLPPENAVIADSGERRKTRRG